MQGCKIKVAFIDTRCRNVVEIPSSCNESCSRICRISVLGIYNACVLYQGLDESGPAEPKFPFIPPAQTVNSVLARFVPASSNSDDSSAKYQPHQQPTNSLQPHRPDRLFIRHL
jgi:hypothetical protein